MNAKYKNVFITIGIGGTIFLLATLYERYLKAKRRKLNPQSLIDNLKDFGELKIETNGFIKKSQVAFIIGLANRYLLDHFKGERRRAAIYRQTLLAKFDIKNYINALVDAVNFEYKCVDDLCNEICNKLEIPEELFEESKDYYFEHKDLEFIMDISDTKNKIKEDESTMLPSHLNQLKEEIKFIMPEIIKDPSMKLTAEIKLNLRDGDVLEMHKQMLKLKAIDTVLQRYKLKQGEIEILLENCEMSNFENQQLI